MTDKRKYSGAVKKQISEDTVPTLKNNGSAEIGELFISRELNALSFKVDATTVMQVRVGNNVTATTLQEVTDEGNETSNDIQLLEAAKLILSNYSKLSKGSKDNYSFDGGISRVCVAEKEDQWENGVQYYFNVGQPIIHANSINNDIPDEFYDETREFEVGSRYTVLNTGKTYVCTDATEGEAVWEQVSDRPYKVYTALLTQTGTDAPVATVLENTLGDITFGYISAGVYSIISNDESWDENRLWYGVSGIGNSGAIGINPGNVKISFEGGDLLVICYNNDYSSALDQQLVDTPIEIRVYNNSPA
jgi:hypothetical protein